MWLVNGALRRPYTVMVGILLVIVLGLISYFKTPTDILPNLKVPVVVVFASYRGMPAPDMEDSVTAPLERALTKCDHLQHIESRSLLGIGIIKVFFTSDMDADVASSQVIALVNGEMQNMPPGMLPPTILKYDATAVPVGNLVISSNEHDDKYLLDVADHQIRDAIAGVPGLAAAPVFGGIFRQVQIYVHPRTLEALHMSPMDVAKIINQQSQVIPTGEMRIGTQDYYVSSNSMAADPKAFESIPIYADGRKIVHLRDVADVIDGTRWRTNTVLADNRRAVYMPLLRQAGASAVAVVDNVKAFLPKLHERAVVPEDVHVDVTFDQAQYVREAISNLQFEGLSGAILASLVVLLFLGSLRSTWIVALAIPLSVLAAFAGLYLTGNTLNIMTLGGLALVLGRVVDDSIVDVENTVRHLNLGSPPLEAARESAREIAGPVLVATVTTVIVFLPLIYMEGVGKYLFTPLAVSASLAMFASYIVSRTVSPLYCSRFLKPHGAAERFPWRLFAVAAVVAAIGLGAWLVWTQVDLSGLPFGGTGATVVALAAIVAGIIAGILVALAPVIGLLFWVAPRFDRFYESVAAGYVRVLHGCVQRRWTVVGVVALMLIPAALALKTTGQELFPGVDSGEFTVHVRVAGGPNVEETEKKVMHIDDLVREIIPPEDLVMTLANIGLSSRWSAVYTPNNGPHAAFVRVQLRSGFQGRTTPVSAYVERLRERLRAEETQDDFFFETGGIIQEILNAGAVAPIEVQIFGQDADKRRAVTRKLHAKLEHLDPVHLAKITDTYMPQGMRLPELHIRVNRDKAALLHYTQTDVMRNVIAALMSSAQIAPNVWIEQSSGNAYFIGVQFAEHEIVDVHSLEDVPISGERSANGPVRLLKEVATIERNQGPIEIYHENIQRINQLFISVRGSDLAGVAGDVRRIADEMKGELPPDMRIEVQGEVSSMRDSFKQMAGMLALALLLVYLIMAGQFASWLDPFIMIVAAPLGLIGVAFTLWLTGTSLNVQSCMGVLMMVGISVSNSVLLVEFANQQRAAGLSTLEAIITAARIRLRPILMTTIATVVALAPMALHLRPGDEMNLPLARAVIGGLVGSTLLTLFVVPVLYVFLKPSGPAAVPALGGDA